MKTLRLWNFYTREDVHSIFSPDTVFTPQSGTWGLQGIVKIPGREGDWVFFVTLGQIQGDHAFDESITTDGVLSWQSQPNQGFGNDAIQSFISHDERINNIHLFLRGKRDQPYGYFGKLGYLTHDAEREKPVHFQWQLMDWAPSSKFLEEVGIKLIEASEILQIESKSSQAKQKQKENTIDFVDPPNNQKKRTGSSTKEFKTRKISSYSQINASNSALGLFGEELVIDLEIKNLLKNNRKDLAEKIIHVSVIEGDGAGYDIKSFTPEGEIKYIEVKTTKGTGNTPFYLTPNELEFSKLNPANYYLYRLYDLDVDQKAGKIYVLSGDISLNLDLKPTQYLATLLAKNE